MHRFHLIVVILVLSVICHQNLYSQNSDSEGSEEVGIELSPESWPAHDQIKYHQLNSKFGGQNQLASSHRGVVSGTTGASAIRAGIEALNRGGSAADAALTTSLTQIALAQGCWVSYAGILSMVYFDSQSGQVYCLNAGYNTVLQENDAATIPATRSGRTALVPGFMAGVESAHRRFGKLPFEAVFEPAIWYAENGFELHALHVASMNMRKETLSRFPETRSIFTDPTTGDFYQAGDLFKQPQLAKTLRAVATNGSAYLYHGPWAEKLVAAVQSDGGKMSLADLQQYQVMWTTPLRLKHNGYTVFCPGLPAQGGVHLAETLNLMSLAKLRDKGHYSKSPESFFWLSQFNNVMALSFLPSETQKAIFGEATPLKYRSTNEFAEKLWGKMRQGEFPLTQTINGMGDNHSDAVVAADQWGNVAAIVHSINTSAWGKTGIFVDGISIPDSACFQQLQIAQLKPGSRLPDPTLPLVVLRDDKPVAALSSIGAGLHAKSITSLSNLVDFDQDIKTAIDAPSMHLPLFGIGGPPTQQVFKDDFSDELICAVKKMGLKIKVIPNTMQARAPRGYVVGLSINPDTGERNAVATKVLNAGAVGQ